MNIQTLDILNAIHTKPFTNQRNLAKESGNTLGIVNRCIKELMEYGYIDEHMRLAHKAKNCLSGKRSTKRHNIGCRLRHAHGSN